MFTGESRGGRGLGILILRHEDYPRQPPYEESSRMGLVAKNVKGRQAKQDGGRYIDNIDTIGDVMPALVWDNATRSIPGHFIGAAPAIIQGGNQNTLSQPPSKAKATIGGAGSVQNGSSITAGGSFATTEPNYVPTAKNGTVALPSESASGSKMLPVINNAMFADVRFSPIGYATPMDPDGFGPIWPEFVDGLYGIAMPSSNEPNQENLFFPCDPRLWAINYGPNWKAGTYVCDTDENGDTDPERKARLQSALHVIKQPLGYKSNALALQISESGNGDCLGGFVFDSSMNDVIGMLSVVNGGFIDVGRVIDPHNQGYDADGNPINSAHLSLQSLFIDRNNRAWDGPLLHEGAWKGAVHAPFRTYTHFESHNIGNPLNPNFGTSYVHRWAGESFMNVPNITITPGHTPTDTPKPPHHPDEPTPDGGGGGGDTPQPGGDPPFVDDPTHGGSGGGSFDDGYDQYGIGSGNDTSRGPGGPVPHGAGGAPSPAGDPIGAPKGAGPVFHGVDRTPMKGESHKRNRPRLGVRHGVGEQNPPTSTEGALRNRIPVHDGGGRTPVDGGGGVIRVGGLPAGSDPLHWRNPDGSSPFDPGNSPGGIFPGGKPGAKIVGSLALDHLFPVAYSPNISPGNVTTPDPGSSAPGHGPFPTGAFPGPVFPPAMINELQLPSWLARANHPSRYSADLRYDTQPSEADVLLHDRTAPISGHIMTYGAVGGAVGADPGDSAPNTWVKTQGERTGKFWPGTTNGGFWVIPPETDTPDVVNSFAPPNTSLSKTYFGFAPNTFLGFGLPCWSNGEMTTGWKFGVDATGKVALSSVNSSGVATERASLNADGTLTGFAATPTMNAVFAATADATVGNTNIETSLIGSGVGAASIPSDVAVGDSTRVLIRGNWGNKANPVGTIDIKGKIAGAINLDTGVVTSGLQNFTGRPFEIEMVLTCRSTGVAGVFTGVLLFKTQTATFGGVSIGSATWSGTIDTTAAMPIDVTWTWGTADNANTITSQVCKIDTETP